ncbi:hypothetical protein ACLOJK_005476 [Asimina triloba]
MELLPSAGEHADATTTPPDSHRSRAPVATTLLPPSVEARCRRTTPLKRTTSQRHWPAKPTTAKPVLPRSEPFITTATTSSFQIRRGRKPTLIKEATRGASSSPIINKFNSIPLRSPSGHPFFQKLLPPFLVINEAWISGSRPFIMLATVPIICQHAHEPARCHGRRLHLPPSLPALATASARCPLPASTAFIHAVRCLQQRPRSSGSKAPPA